MSRCIWNIGKGVRGRMSLSIVLYTISIRTIDSKSPNLFSPTRLAFPVQPTPLILPNILPPRLPRKSRRRPTPHPRLAEKHYLHILARPLKPVAVFKLLACYKPAVRLRDDGDVERAGDCAGGFELGGLAGVYQYAGRVAGF